MTYVLVNINHELYLCKMTLKLNLQALVGGHKVGTHGTERRKLSMNVNDRTMNFEHKSFGKQLYIHSIQILRRLDTPVNFRILYL